MALYSIAYGRVDDYARELALGLSRMRNGFAATLCAICCGRGEYSQTYTRGCGMGYATHIGACDFCDGTGLLQGDKPAPASVREQVLVAARRGG